VRARLPALLPAATAAVAAALLLAGCMLFRSPEGVGTISAEDLASRIQAGRAPVVLDVRSVGEYEEGHIPGAINIPYDEVGERLADIPASEGDEIVVHCKSGVRARMAERTLQDVGYTNLRHLEGDMQGWVAAGHPID